MCVLLFLMIGLDLDIGSMAPLSFCDSCVSWVLCCGRSVVWVPELSGYKWIYVAIVGGYIPT